jgi:hypothetical protein
MRSKTRATGKPCAGGDVPAQQVCYPGKKAGTNADSAHSTCGGGGAATL